MDRHVNSSVIQDVDIPISFRALPHLVHMMWDTIMRASSTIKSKYGTPHNLNIFLKCSLALAEAKLDYARIKAERGTRHTFSIDDLALIARNLPFPLAKYLESIGSFKTRGQLVVPALIRAAHAPEVASGLLNLAPSQLKETVRALEQFVPSTNELVAQARQVVEIFPDAVWETRVVQGETQIKIKRETAEFWGTGVTSPEERRTFMRIIWLMQGRKVAIVDHDLLSGTGTAAQAVRFNEQYSPTFEDKRYYMNIEVVPEIDEKLGIAFQLGYEYGGALFSRFCTSDQNCLKYGDGHPDTYCAALLAPLCTTLLYSDSDSDY